MLEDAAAGLVGLGGGIITGLLGFGGALGIPAFLALVLGASQHDAQAIALTGLLPPVTWPALREYRRAGIAIPGGLVASVMVGFVVFAGVGGVAVQYVPALLLRRCFALFVLVIAARTALTLRSPSEAASEAQVTDARFGGTGLAIGAVGGLVAGLMGVAGGLVLVPLLRRWARLPALQAQAVTLAVMLPPIALPAVLAYAHARGGVPWGPVIGVAVGFALGTAAGGRLAVRVPRRPLGLVYVAVMVAAAALLLARG